MRKLCWIGLLAACSSPTAAPSPSVHLTIVAGNDQVGAAAFHLMQPLLVRVVDGDGNPIAGASVQWSTSARGGELIPARSITNSEGIARAVWRLGRDDGLQYANASYLSAPAAQFQAIAASGDAIQAGGPRGRQCGVFGDGEVRCWTSPDRGPPEAIAIDTDLRFASLAFAVDRWCGGTLSGSIACIHDAELTPAGMFRPEAAPVHIVADGVPVMVRLGGAGTPERATTWCGQAINQTVWCWGNNDAGQLGRGSIGGSSDQPQQIASEMRIVSHAVTVGAACAIDVQGVAWCWGDSADRVVDSDSPSAVPVAVPTVHRFSQVAGDGSGAMCAVSELQVYCWGSNAAGGRGRTGLEASSEPVAVEGTMFYVSISGGSDGFLALTNDRTIVAWGGLPAQFGARPVELIRDHVFASLLPGGGESRCVRAYPVGTRCLDRVALARDASAAPPRLYGVPGGAPQALKR
jgi:hypothetical protein